MARVVKYPYSGLQGLERDLVKVLHEAEREVGFGRRRGGVVWNLVDLGCLTLRAQLVGDASAEQEYLEAWDVDARCARAAWLQFTVAELAAEVITGDSLSGEVRSRWLTPGATVIAAAEASGSTAASGEDVA